MNASEITGKPLNTMKVVFNGAGAAGISCAKMFIDAGISKENLLMCDSKGIITTDRTGLSEEKALFARKTDKSTLGEALVGADCFVGLSAANCVTGEMIKPMADQPIIFAMANPDPEIHPELARKFRPDVIMATGRSDFPNQINNVLGFPFIFRGAMDVRASRISEGMKMAAAKALAALTKEEVPEIVKKAYGGADFSFGPGYIVPKPFDPRVIEWEAVAVAKAACDEGLAKHPISDWDAYRAELRDRMVKFWD